MKPGKYYFVMNKESDFSRGRGKGILADRTGLALAPDAERGVYYSRVFDSREKKTTWHRLRFYGLTGTESSVQVTVYASESRLVMSDGIPVDAEDAIRRGNLSWEELDRCFEPYIQERFTYPQDVLLHRVRGRYLWFRLDMEASGGRLPSLTGAQIYFPKDTWMKYLPEIYQQGEESTSFLERYLGIFQSMYEDMTKQIEEVPDRLNPRTADLPSLRFLAEWVGIEHAELWNEEQLRWLTANAIWLHQYRGTVRFLKEIMKLYTGKEPYVVERHRLEPYFDGSEKEKQLKQLYSSNPYEFTLLVNTDDMETGAQDSTLRQLADMARPAGMDCRIVVLKPYIFLGQYSYLGINSVLGQYKAMELNGLCAVPFTTIAGNER